MCLEVLVVLHGGETWQIKGSSKQKMVGCNLQGLQRWRPVVIGMAPGTELHAVDPALLHGGLHPSDSLKAGDADTGRASCYHSTAAEPLLCE